MPDQIITVDVNINSDALRQIPQYKAAFESLKTSVANLNTEILKQNNQSKETVNWGTKIVGSVKELTDNYELFQKIIGIATSGIKGWQDILAAGFTLITTYGPQILDFLGEMFQSEKTKEAAEALKTYNDVMESYKNNVSDELSQLGMLVSMATSDKLSKEGRLEAIKQLNNLSPEYLNNLTSENIKTKEGIGLINEYTASLNRKAMEEAIQVERVKLVKQRLDLKPTYEAAFQRKEEYRTGKKPRYEEYTQAGHEINGVYIAPSKGKTDMRKMAYQSFANFSKQDLDILKKIKILDDTLAETLLRYAPKPDLNKTPDKAYWEAELAAQQKQLDKLDAGAKNFEIKAKPIIKKITDIKNTLRHYTVNETTYPKPSPKPKPIRLPQLKRPKSVINIQNDKVEYDQQLTLLDDSRQKKLISEEDYYKQSKDLQEKFHQNIGNNVRLFAEKEMADMMQRQRDLVEAETAALNAEKNAKIAADEKAIKKAILPGQQFDAEKKLIDDKYNYDILLAGNNNARKKELELKHQQDITALTQQYEQQRKEFALNTAQQVSDKAFAIIGNNIKSSSDAKIKGLEKDKAGELSNKNLTQTQRKAIEDKYKKKENEEKVKAFKAEQRASVLQAVVNGALAITKATAQTGVLAAFVIPGIIASTALQVATIISQKPPAFAKGGRFVSDGRGALLPGYSRTDNTNAYLRSGEAVVVSEAMRNPWARNLVSAINVAHGGRDFSIPNLSRGYAIGGIFTDGGNANRYYNQPVNDIKDMANTLAYQMINNFPPIYVDVKDVNNQQNILAQTVNRVNL